MQWILLLLGLAGCFAAVISISLHRKTDRLKFLGFFWASIFFTAVNISLLLLPIFTEGILHFLLLQVIEWGHVFTISLVLSSLLLYIRESKPEFSRFPKLYAIFPFAIILSYLLVYNTVLLKEWLLSIYQAGAAIVAVLMYGIYFYRESMYRTVFIGGIFFFLTYMLHVLLPPSYKIIWQVALFISIITVFSGYLILERKSQE